MAKTLIVAEVTNEGKLRKVSFELASAARAVGGDFAAVVIGAGAGAVAVDIAARGATKVYAVGGAFNSAASSAIAGAIKTAVDAEGAQVVLFGFTALGRDVSSRLAAKLDAGLLSDVTALELDGDGRIVATKPLYAGKIISKCRLHGGGVSIISIRPNNFPPAGMTGGSCEIVELTADTHADNAVTKELRAKEAGAVDLKEADVIISGGRGVKGPEGFEPLRKVANRFGWALGASRAAVDSGWIEHAHQVGQTGKTVNPKLYFACGISGAIQHLAGMQTSKVIVAINSDPEAPIFQLADYGIVGDLFMIVPLLEEEIAKAMG
jgi:electron transfer flavoprotein alpha subunit